jgi:hypothetical protein
MGAIAVIMIVIALDLHFGRTRQRGGGRLKPVINAVQQMMVMMLFPVKWPPLMLELASVFEGVTGFLDVSIVSPTCLGIPFTFFNRFLWSSLISFACALLPFVGGAIFALFRAWLGKGSVGDKTGQVDDAGRTGGNQTDKLTKFYKTYITGDPSHLQEQLGKIPFLITKHAGDYPKMWEALEKKYNIEDMSTFKSRLRVAWQKALPVATIYGLTVVLFVHPAVSGLAFYFFKCREIKDIDPPLLSLSGAEASDVVGNAAAAVKSARSYLEADYSLECYDNDWNTMFPYA